MRSKKVFFYQLVTALLLLICSFTTFAATTNDNSPRFLAIADIHFDPFTACGNQKPCQLIEDLRAAPTEQWEAILTQQVKDQPKYFEDSNFLLLKSSLDELKNIAKTKQPKFVLVLGDMLAHHFRQLYTEYSSDTSQQSYQEFVKKTLTFLKSQTAQAFPSIDVFSAVGNNDSYEDDYVSEPNGSFYQDTGNTWSDLIHTRNTRAAMQQQFPTGGYYAVNIPSDQRLRLIVMNTVLFSDHITDNNILDAANEELTWLHEQLQQAAYSGQKVIIAMHIPPGVDIYSSLKKNPFSVVELWHPEFTQRFNDEMNQYSTYVVGIFSGHFHMDLFQVYHYQHNIPLNGTPSISPVFGNNPGFKLFSYDENSLEMKNYQTYYLPLSMLSAINTQSAWTEEYDFDKTYQPTCSSCTLLDGVRTLRLTGRSAKNYKQYFNLQSPNAQPIAQFWSPYYWCETQSMTSAEYQACLVSTH